MIDLNWVCGLWGNNHCRFLQKEMVGNSGGQLFIWDSNCFDVTNSFISDFCIGVHGKWMSTENDFSIINVYGPHDDHNKKRCWSFLYNKICGSSDEAWAVCGDFNEVRDAEERLNCIFSESRAKMFNEFIDKSKLIDIPLGKSDDYPIILKDDDRNFGPKPIKVFDEWLNNDGIDDIMKGVWAEDVGGGSLALKTKSSQKFGNLEGEIEMFKLVANALELRAEHGLINEEERKQWLDARREWFQREQIKANMLKQKARIRWTLEGDENTKYLHSNLFEEHTTSTTSLVNLVYPTLTSDEARCLESPTCEEEILMAINDCGNSKAPEPDGFNLHFFKKFWDVIKVDVVHAIS
ncbi:uncharacterized protein [Rutidosis leptorrhynchoides]|uniref:uncharacterized protein n=1 Tax=Rutidosis leptorrhynchoides TaxID=125765 RepID=UPI003A992084